MQLAGNDTEEEVEQTKEKEEVTVYIQGDPGSYSISESNIAVVPQNYRASWTRCASGDTAVGTSTARSLCIDELPMEQVKKMKHGTIQPYAGSGELSKVELAMKAAILRRNHNFCRLVEVRLLQCHFFKC